MPLILLVTAASPDAKLVGDGFEVLMEVKCACPFDEKDDGRGWLWAPYKKALSSKGINVRHYVQCQVQMLAANINYCFLVGWDTETFSESCKVALVPFNSEW